MAATQTVTVQYPPEAALESGPPSPPTLHTPSGAVTPSGVATPAAPPRTFAVDQFHGLTRTRRVLILGLIMFSNLVQVSRP